MGQPDLVRFRGQYVTVPDSGSLGGLWADPLIMGDPGICFLFSCPHSWDHGAWEGETSSSAPLLESGQEQVLLTGP